jgi:hypothetical protein
MYSKSEAASIKKEFWTSFGAYMKPILNADAQSINWVNYKTGIKNIFFRTDVDNKKASISIELKHSSGEERKEVYEKLLSMKVIFDEHVFGDWIWLAEAYDEDGSEMSKINTDITDVNIFNKNDWPRIISFFKQNLISLDLFWCMVKAHFE